jgi:hypothetical protein
VTGEFSSVDEPKVEGELKDTGDVSVGPAAVLELPAG